MWADAPETGDDRGVFTEASVAVELDEVLRNHADVVGGLRAVGVAGDADDLGGAETLVDLLEKAVVVRPQSLDLGGEVVPAHLRPPLERTDLALDLNERLFELHGVGNRHRGASVRGWPVL